MQHTTANYNYQHARRSRLLLRLEQIRQTMLCDDVRLLDLVGGSSPEVLGRVADELTDYADDLQKAYLAYGSWDLAASERVAEVGGSWPAVAEGLQTLDDIVSADLRALPTSMGEDERALTRAIFYCALAVDLCPAYGKATVGDLRRTLRLTAALAESAAGPSEPFGAVPTFLGVEREAGDRLSREDLVFSELYEEEAWGIELFLEPHDNDLFCKMDALWVATQGELPTALDPPEFLEAVRSSERVRKMREEFEEGRRISRHVGEEEYLRTLTNVDRATWLAMRDVERYEAVRAGLDSCDEEALKDIISDFGFSTLEDASNVLWRPEEWLAATHEERVSFVRGAMEWLLDEARYRDEHGDDLAEMDEWYYGRLSTFGENARTWAAEVGGMDELFAQYRIVREGFFGQNLPQGAHEGFGNEQHVWVAEGFGGLADGALETLLGERGVSRSADDDLFFQTFGYLDEAKYRMDELILQRMMRRV